jgi:hypothetical protein
MTSDKKSDKKVKVLIVKSHIDDKKLDKKEGFFFPEDYYEKIIDYDADVYYLDENNNKKLLLKLRKNVIPDSLSKKAYNSLYKVSQKKSTNRGAASGLIKTKKLPNYVGKIHHKDKFRVFYYDKNGTLKKDNIGNIAMSNIVGYYDKPDRNHYTKKKTNPKSMCRTTAFTSKEVDKWKNTLPLIKVANKQFKLLVPSRHKIQYNQAKQTPKYQIENTAFSTVTTNYNWRTACHKDKGDLEEGFGNLLVLEKDKCCQNKSINSNNGRISKCNCCSRYKGGYLGFPKFKICVDVRQGDFLAMDVHQWHCNTPIIPDMKKQTNANNNTRKKHGRLSLVCYLRKNMIKCK